MSLRVVTWNMGGFTPGLNSAAKRREAWRLLGELEPSVDVALLQEASRPPTALLGCVSGDGPRAQARLWTPQVALQDPVAVVGVAEHGWVSTARIRSSVEEITLISLHAKTQGSVVAHIEALLARVAEQMTGRFILGGDFNSCRAAESVWPGYRHLEFFENARARYGMVNCFWEGHGREQRTYWQGCKDVGQPFQDDHFFISADLANRSQSCTVLDYEPFRGISDHAPLVLDLDLDAT